MSHPDHDFSQAAMEAIGSASRGHVTDVFGNRFHYNALSDRSGFTFVASSKSFAEARKETADTELCHSGTKAMVFDQLLKDSVLMVNGEPQAKDIAMDTTGKAMTAAWLSNVFDSHVLSFEARECTAMRYLKLNACRLSLKYEHGYDGPKNVFVKQ
ncbi:hypothetical protein FGB62_241g08 [Gracilaria domingensis]|nr:hypothetical protein FGB62_241g08 [Gracilaria domingensis]